KTLKPGIDVGGGTSLIYEIDAAGLEPEQTRNLSERMINVLRRRVDPANVQNLIWRPLGSLRLEIQMPLASVQAQEKRRAYNKAKDELLNENIVTEVILSCLSKPAAERSADFNDFAKGDPNRLEILGELATAYDEYMELRSKSDNLAEERKSAEKQMSDSGLDIETIRQNVSGWSELEEEELTEELKSFLGSEENLELLSGYVKTYAEWAEVARELIEEDTGKRDTYQKAKDELNGLNLSEDEIDLVLSMSRKSAKRRAAIAGLKLKFADRAAKIDRVVATFDDYRPYRGRLDDPKDLQRMLKGAGVLEFRILPTFRHARVNDDEMAGYVETLKTKGPKYASTDEYVWCEIEKPGEWLYEQQGRIFSRVTDGQEGPAVIGRFGDKWYVLASNKGRERMLHAAGAEQKEWKLERSRPAQDEMGRRAIGFLLDEKGGILFYRVTKNNVDRPLCILLDGLAISAPNISEAIGRRGIIKGAFSETEQQDMVDKLDAGSLPARLIEEPISERTIGPMIGADNRDKGIKAGFVGLVVVVLCMLVYYMLSGGIADVALLMNILFVLAIMALLRATFTLPGIAGIILTIGMSVDANVLIFERIREELQKGASLRIAIRNGYQRAFRTIFDANVTTFITAAILYWVASEEIKGFAIVLMLGIVSSMFTALFVTRVIFDVLLAKRIIKDRLPMLSLIHRPNVNWMGLRPVFFGISSVLIVVGLIAFFTRADKYDIEFTGGTAAVINLKDGVDLSRQDVEDKIHEVGRKLDNALAAAKVYSLGKAYEGDFFKQYEINTTETNKTTVTVTLAQEQGRTAESVQSAIKKAEGKFRGRLSNLVVKASGNPSGFVVATSQMNQTLVKQVLGAAFPDAELSEPKIERTVDEAILSAFGDQLEIQRNLQPQITEQTKITEEVVAANPELSDFLGGIKITCEIETAAAGREIEQRFKDLQFKPEMQDLTRYSYRIVGTDLAALDPNVAVRTFVYLSADPEAGLRELGDDEWTQFVANETARVRGAAELETSLPQVTQIDPSVGAEQKTRALIAIILSLFAIIAYIWLRFGDLRYGVAAIVALVHDVCITLGAVTASAYIASMVIGETLLIGDFKIDLAMIAAFLTLIGYSLNDTIVVFDRIRENRRKAQLNQQIITNSINQTISRTLLTSFTTFIVVLIMYIFGGQGLRGFTFAIGFGILVGTYSSIAIAAPVLLLGSKSKEGGSKQGRAERS
ncbi:MAG: protein translocase subunit SecD, partial [Planctomycetota bacterium]